MTDNLFDIAGRTYFVTGASSGIGRTVTGHLLSVGANVIGVARTIEKLETLVQETQDLVGHLVVAAADVTDSETLKVALDRGVAKVGPLNGAVLTAGINVREPVLNIDPASWQAIVDTNLTGYLNSAQLVGQALQGRGGSIVAIGSLSVQMAYPNNGSYSASKAGLTQLSRVMAVEWAADNVRVNILAPGRIRTPLIESVVADPAQMEWMMMRIPMKRLGTPEDLVGPVQFLLSDASRYMTGALLVVDGGWEVAA